MKIHPIARGPLQVGCAFRPNWVNVALKLVLEILLSILLHPIAMVLMWINLAGRQDMYGGKKLIWFLVSILWGLGPILYILVADGGLW